MGETFRIKPLEWKPFELMRAKAEMAKTPFGHYEVYEYSDGNYIAEFRYGGSNYLIRIRRNRGVSMEQAKAACEQHWNETIKQALVKV